MFWIHPSNVLDPPIEKKTQYVFFRTNRCFTQIRRRKRTFYESSETFYFQRQSTRKDHDQK